MDRTALTANPLSYSQTCDTFRPRLGQCATSRAGLGGKRFIHFFIPCAIRNRLVRKHRFEGMPRCVVNAFRHLGLGEFSAADIANSDVIESPHDVRTGLVQEVLPGVGDLGVNLRRQSFLSGPLRLSQFFFKLPKASGMLDLLAVGQGGKVFKAQVNSNAAHRFSGFSVRNINDDVQEPIAAPVLAEAGAVLDLAFRQGPGIEYAKCVTGESERIAVAFQVPTFEWHPAQRPLAAIAQVRALELISRLGVLRGNGIDGAGMDAKFLAATRGQLVKIEPGRPPLTPLERVLLRVVAEVPDAGNRPRLLVQQAVQRLHTVAVNLGAHWRFRYSSIARRMCSDTGSPVFLDKAFNAAISGSGKKMFMRRMC